MYAHHFSTVSPTPTQHSQCPTSLNFQDGERTSFPHNLLLGVSQDHPQKSSEVGKHQQSLGHTLSPVLSHPPNLSGPVQHSSDQSGCPKDSPPKSLLCFKAFSESSEPLGCRTPSEPNRDGSGSVLLFTLCILLG